MRKKMKLLLAVTAVGLSLLTGCSSKKEETWTVTCPWAPSGVASLVSQKAAGLSPEFSKDIVLVAEAIKGDSATVNSWIKKTNANDPELVFIGEGMFSITSILDPSKLQFTYDDLEYIENLYSAIFVMSAYKDLNVKNLNELKDYLEKGNKISVATNGAVGSEAFLAAALFGSMGYGDQMKLVSYSSAAEAAQAVAKGETDLAVSHQSQILETYQQGNVQMICAFDEDTIEEGPFKGLEGVGEKGYPYFRNRCLIFSKEGTEQEKILKLKKLYKDILTNSEMVAWLNDTMLLEDDTLTEEEVKEHIENVKSIVTQYKDIVVK